MVLFMMTLASLSSRFKGDIVSVDQRDLFAFRTPGVNVAFTPLAELIEDLVEAFATVGQGVFNLGGHLFVHVPTDDAVSF